MRVIKCLLCMVVCYLIVSCDYVSEKEKSEKLRLENEQLSKHLEEKKIEEKRAESEKQFRERPPFSLPKYVFVVIEMEKTVPDIQYIYDAVRHKNNPTIVNVKKKYNFVSGIEQFDNFNEEIKYKFMDDMQSHHSVTGDMEFYNSKVVNRLCFDFDDYSSASIARSKYTIN